VWLLVLLAIGLFAAAKKSKEVPLPAKVTTTLVPHPSLFGSLFGNGEAPALPGYPFRSIGTGVGLDVSNPIPSVLVTGPVIIYPPGVGTGAGTSGGTTPSGTGTGGTGLGVFGSEKSPQIL